MQSGDNRNRQFPNKINTTTTVKLLILHLLSQKSYYGNELIEKIESTLKYRWKPSPGMIYPLLRILEDNLLIEGWWDEPDKKTKRHYRITDTGIKHYNNVKMLYKPMYEESLIIIDSILNTIYK